MTTKVALVSGAAAGIGAACAKRLARDGIAVGVHRDRGVGLVGSGRLRDLELAADRVPAGPLAGALKNWSCLRHGMPPPSSGTQALRNCSESLLSALGLSTPARRPARSRAID